MRTSPHRSRWLPLSAIILIVGSTARGSTLEAPPQTLASEAGALLLGPIEGVTTGWHVAPDRASAPLGLVLPLRLTVLEEVEVTWLGAVETTRDPAGSTAECPLVELGSQTVQVELVWPDGRSESRSMVVDVIDAPVESIAVDRVDVWVDRVQLEETPTNDETMEYYFGGSIARLTEGSERLFTSVDRRLHLTARPAEPAFADLVEWRVDGVPLALGARFDHDGFGDIGTHTFSAGPPGREGTAELGIYAVRVRRTSHLDEVVPPDGEPVSFVARTFPLGLEEHVRWLASTKFGSTSPVLGTGPEFVVTFHDTVGPGPSGDDHRWIGVRADNATLGVDARVTIERADICGDAIRTQLDPAEGMGRFTLTLQGPGGNATIVDEQRNGGSYTDDFGFAGLADNGEFTTVMAVWEVGDTTVDDSLAAHFTKLGDYRHTQYNCPSEADATCAGAPIDVCFTDVACDYTPGMLPAPFVAQVSDDDFGTGCGQTIAHGDIQLEAFCPNAGFPPPPECAGDELFRENTAIAPACGGALNANTVAASPANLAGRLPCGTRICISPGASSSEKTVTDRCPGCAADQLDNYSDSGACGILDFCANCLTVKLH